ncbi:hypothetical protein CHF27_004230 [Romboutsia maritimum]|uniref:DUF2178 domain-containing protein n=1 Tax=Romboutsia maritimum TaxID=2020948 RepID=A0A371IUY4_9FIRM|nr:hypothetical protein [Romboutsia maritimum]RDY24297.1 hypothetical protein CHF27_004230 [Romboutsia maritimum]
MKIKGKRSFVNAILFLVLTMICIGAIIINGYNQRLVVSTILMLLISSLYFYWAFSTKGIEEEIKDYADERELLNAMKSGHTALKITNLICLVLMMSFLLIYSIFKIDLFLIVAITLCFVICLMFIILIACDSYYEKNN